jgi:hypothetical protein
MLLHNFILGHSHECSLYVLTLLHNFTLGHSHECSLYVGYRQSFNQVASA